MTKLLFERCPSCKTDLSNALSRYFFESAADLQFTYDCGGCGTKLDILVELTPHFYCETHKAEVDDD